MRCVAGRPLWLGNSRDTADLRQHAESGVEAIVDLALNEAPASPAREIIYCRIPIIDGTGNPPTILRLAVETTGILLRNSVPTLVACGMGMSRCVAIAAAAISAQSGTPLDDCLEELTHNGPADVSPALWADVRQACGLAS